jgi:putative oxygen-independent coproporphyrinogen III oxidase
MDNLSIYIHYPFCKSKCPYCDFNSHLITSVSTKKYANAYKKELDYFKKIVGKRNITSIFFGGGTPSLMADELIAEILNHIHKLWQVTKNCEITLEANPTSSEYNKFANFKNLGINRLSLGIQSLNDDDLKFLGREHSSKEAIKAINMAGSHFNNYSFDLIYARPNQDLQSWQKELTQALEIGTPHLSLYQLTIEKGTPFFKEYKNGNFILPNNDAQEKLYDLTYNICSRFSLDLYEISNYAKKNYDSIHNLNYWNYGDYIGVGAGAHSRITDIKQNRIALNNYHLPHKWLEYIEKNNHAIQQQHILDNNQILNEITLMGLRSKYGVTKSILKKYFKQDHLEIFSSKLADLKESQLINYNENGLQATYKGFKLLNSISSYLLN